MKFLAIIPARYASTRFEGKPLADLGGQTVIERCYRRVKSAVEDVVVATDDLRILHAVEAFGGKAVMTSTAHRSGTDRCLEAYEKLGIDADIIINVQGDEPFIDPEQIRQLMGCFDNHTTQIATLALPYPKTGSYEELENPNRPKVVMDADGNALLFSRSVIPYMRGVERSLWPSKGEYFTHIGMYAFRSEILKEICHLPQSRLELDESLEQLRWLENGYRIRVGITNRQTIGIDTPADLERARKLLKST